jgi:ribosomal protein S18 acetylase RimI-like enzyme
VIALSYEFRPARHDDLAGIASVFAAAFPESIAHYFDTPPAPLVVAEPFSLCLESEPDALYVADAGSGKIAGYIFAPAQTGRLPWVALKRGIAFRWVWRWLSGQYRVGMAPIRALTLNKLDFLTSARQPDVKAEARILSIAVHPDHQGKGLQPGATRRSGEGAHGINPARTGRGRRRRPRGDRRAGGP